MNALAQNSQAIRTFVHKQRKEKACERLLMSVLKKIKKLKGQKLLKSNV